MSTWGKAWDHKLRIKHIFMVDGPFPLATDETQRMAKDVAGAVTKLRDRLPQEDPLWVELDDCLDGFADLAEVKNEYEAQARFNEALSNLYDIGDYGKRVWIE